MTKPSVPGAAVPAGRWSRMARLGTLTTNVAGGMLAEGARQLAQGKRPVLAGCTHSLISGFGPKRASDGYLQSARRDY